MALTTMASSIARRMRLQVVAVSIAYPSSFMSGDGLARGIVVADHFELIARDCYPQAH